MITYNKLVRDKIPEIIEKSGKTCIIEILDDIQYIAMLEAKLNEELVEYQSDKNIEELADIYEIMLSIIKARGWSLEQLEQVRADKAESRGKFDKKILLKEVSEK